MEDGWGFVWPPYSATPFLVRPSDSCFGAATHEQRVYLVTENYVPYLPTGTETDWTEHQIDWTAISAMDECKSSYWEDDGNVEVSPQRRMPAMPIATASGPLDKTAQQILADKRKEDEKDRKKRKKRKRDRKATKRRCGNKKKHKKIRKKKSNRKNKVSRSHSKK